MAKKKKQKIEIEAHNAGHLELAHMLFGEAEDEKLPISVRYLMVKAGDMILADWHRFHKPNMEKIMQMALED